MLYLFVVCFCIIAVQFVFFGRATVTEAISLWIIKGYRNLDQLEQTTLNEEVGPRHSYTQN